MADFVYPEKPDVLIIGGGLAGLMAALAARENGRTASIASLGPAGRSGNSVVAGAVISSASGDLGNTADVFLQDLLASGQGLAEQALAGRLAEESTAMLSILEQYGVFMRRKDGGFERRHPPGHSLPRTMATNWDSVPFSSRGMTFLAPLAKRAAEAKVGIIDGFRATSLLKDGIRVTGVAGYDRKSGEPRRIHAGSVILTTGGYGALFRRNNNVSDIYGDGIAMALEAGCTLRDMEFVQFYPLMVTSPLKTTVSEAVLRNGGVLRNKGGEDFLPKYYSITGSPTRDVASRSIWLEIHAGRGVDGCVFADCTNVDEDAIATHFKEFYQLLARRGADPRKVWIRVSPTVHYTLGGICINPDGWTGVPGLYAAGEVTGGVHGVNRLTGSALMEACVFGRASGFAAAENVVTPPGKAVVVNTPGGDGHAPHSGIANALNRLKDLLWDKVSLVRDADGLDEALQTIRAMRAEWDSRPETAGRAFARTLLVAEAMTRSARAREESRGAHYRADFPTVASGRGAPVFCSLKDGEIAIEHGVF